MNIPRIEEISDKKLIGKRINMSLSENKTVELWKSFMPRKKEIECLNNNLFSIQIYGDNLVKLDSSTIFEKWAAIEVDSFDTVPSEMETLTITGGLYAVFIHKGTADNFQSTFNYIFKEWLPDSIFIFDNRPQFEIMKEGYDPNDVNAEEEVWIPIKVLSDKWRFSAHRITKYNPKHRNEQGQFSKEEWTSISNIGGTFDNVVLSESDYLKIERKYIEAVKIVMQLNDCEYLEVKNVETHSKSKDFKRISKHLYPYYKKMDNGYKITLDELQFFVPLILRELAWADLINEDKNLYVRFGYDYYMYFSTNISEGILKPKIDEIGLFLDHQKNIFEIEYDTVN